ncbi:MAG: FKBP-type peptidyl-prolyl cis-trans isomerase [Leptothrix sp. (in: b-proteobacteria)]
MLNHHASSKLSRLHLTALQLAVCTSLLGTLNLAAAQQAAAPAEAAASGVETAGAQRAMYETMKEKVSYAIGVQTARNLSTNAIPFDMDILMQGIKDVAEGHAPRMHEKEMKVVLQSIQNDIHRNMVGNRAELSLKNVAKSQAFIAEYKKKPGVVVLPGNLLYRVLREGHGELPRDESIVQVRYRGTTIDGNEFDATENERGNAMQMSQLVLGWRQAMKQMPVGSQWEIIIPPTLAYGERGVGTTIGPNETLIFNIELLSTRHP